MITVTQNSKLKTQNPLSNLALPVCVSAMDTCWIYALAWLFGAVVLEKFAALPLPSSVIVVGVSLAGWGLTAFLLDHTTLPQGLVRTLSIAIGVGLSVVVMLALNLPSGDLSLSWFGKAIPGILLCFVLWLRGSFRAAKRPAFKEIYFDFQLGLAVVILASVVAPIVIGSRFAGLWTQVAALPVWFFMFSLAALALGNREVIRQEIGATASGSWGLVVGGSIAVIVVIGSLSALFGGPNIWLIAQQVVGAIVFVFASAIYAIAFVVLWLWYIIFKPQPPTQGAVPTAGPTTQQVLDAQKRLNELLRQKQSQFYVPDEVTQIATWIGAILVVLLALWLISFGVRRYRKRTPPITVEDRESIGSWGLLAQQLRDFFNRLLARFRPKTVEQAATQIDDLAALAGRAEWSGTLSVRQIYVRLLALGGTVGYPRAPQQTPVEYLATLSRAMPGLRDDFRAITAAYLEARYGPMPASSPAVRAATDAWQRAEPEMKRATTIAEK